MSVLIDVGSRPLGFLSAPLRLLALLLPAVDCENVKKNTKRWSAAAATVSVEASLALSCVGLLEVPPLVGRFYVVLNWRTNLACTYWYIWLAAFVLAKKLKVKHTTLFL